MNYTIADATAQILAIPLHARNPFLPSCSRGPVVPLRRNPNQGSLPELGNDQHDLVDQPTVAARELVGRLVRDREPLSVVALGVAAHRLRGLWLLVPTCHR